jgi:hypothetical protein
MIPAPGLEEQKRKKTDCGKRRTTVCTPSNSKNSYYGTNQYHQVGISGVSKEEASHLLNATLPAPHDPDTYMIQLEVFHNLHCLNMLRKSLYPDEYPEMVEYNPDGTINHNTLASLHMGNYFLFHII